VVLIPFASALVSHPTLIRSEEGRALGIAAIDHLLKVWKDQGQTHFSEPAEQALRLLALLSHRTGAEDAMTLWRVFADLADASGRPDPMATIALVAGAGDPNDARTRVDRAYDATAAAFSGARRLSESYLSTRSIWDFLADVQQAFAAKGMPTEHRRVVAELGRDVIGRLRPSTAEVAPEGLRASAPWDEVIAALPGRLAVLEWVEEGEVLRPLVTVVRHGDVASDLCKESPVDIEGLGSRITARVRGWHAGRAGDPFDLTG
jgi:hypothetical protein